LWWEAHGLCYGISADITADLARGIAVIASVSRAVIVEAASRFPVRVIEITASPEILAERLNNRAREDANAIAARMARQVALPEHLEIIRIFNDTTIEAGAAQLRQALRR
jgi:phosphonate metabolism protein PhnN/1,5-bisphosphokinase (PRPP-forming)